MLGVSAPILGFGLSGSCTQGLEDVLNTFLCFS